MADPLRQVALPSKVTPRTRRKAVQFFVEATQKSISCVTDAIVDLRRDRAEPLDLTVGDRSLARLRGPSPLFLRIRMQFRVAQSSVRLGCYEVSTVAYSYCLRDAEDREILVYQWHPAGQSHVTFPHLHLGPGARVGRHDLLKAHLPTGQVSLEDFLHLAINDFHVRPRRKDWARILNGPETTEPGSPPVDP